MAYLLLLPCSSQESWRKRRRRRRRTDFEKSREQEWEQHSWETFEEGPTLRFSSFFGKETGERKGPPFPDWSGLKQ